MILFLGRPGMDVNINDVANHDSNETNGEND